VPTMRFVESPELNEICVSLSERELGNTIINGKIEAYQFEDNFGKQFKKEDGVSEIETSPRLIAAAPVEVTSRSRSYSSGQLKFLPTKSRKQRSSSLGDLDEGSSKQLLLDLISTMNESFPDYDFETTKIDQFVDTDVQSSMRTVNSFLAELTTTDARFLERLWRQYFFFSSFKIF
jgi:hypothetical protein